MSDTGSKVPGRVDGVTGSAAQRHTYCHNQASHRNSTKATHSHHGSVLCGREDQDHEHKQPGGKSLAEEVATLVTHCRHGAEHAKLGIAALGGIEMVFVEQIHGNGAEEAAKHLGNYVRQHSAPGELPCCCKAQGHCRIKVSA